MSKNGINPERRRGLLAAAAAGAIAAAVGFGVVTNGVGPVNAEPVRVESRTQAPGFADIVEKVSPAVVSVRVKGSFEPASDRGNGFSFDMPGFDNLPKDHPLYRFFRDFRGDRDFRGGPRQDDRNGSRARPVSQGSGFFISEDGYLVTNNHVVEGGNQYTVVMDDGTEIDAKLIGTDPRTDLALLKVEEERKFTYVDFADDGKVRVGDWVVAVGNPFGLGGTVTAGIVSARGRDIGAGPYDDFIQIDAAVNRGNSGGPAFNLNGEVIGINTAIFSPSGGNVGIAFAIPASVAKDVVAKLMANGEIARGWLIVGAAVVASRVAATLGCLRGLPPAEGSTLGVAVASTVPGPVGAVVVGATAAALTTAGTLAGLPWWQGAAAVVALLAVVGWVVRSALRVFGGINGDVLGAVIEVGLGTLLVVLTVGIAS